MSHREEHHLGSKRYPSLVWPVLLIAAGLTLLLNNLGVLDVSLWQLWRLWPVLLILAGLDIMLGRRSRLGSIVMLLVTVGAVAAVLILLISRPDALGASRSAGVERIDEPIDGVERADLEIDFAAGELEVGRLSDSSRLIRGVLDLATENQPQWNIRRTGSRATMDLAYPSSTWIQSWQRGDDWTIELSPKVGYSININMAAGDAVVDLTGLTVNDLRVTSGAGRSTVTLPREGRFPVVVTGGLGQLNLEIPEGMAARIQVDRGIGQLQTSGNFEVDDGVYQTPNWETSNNRVDVEIKLGIGQVTVTRR